jgi:hypothetical protein
LAFVLVSLSDQGISPRTKQEVTRLYQMFAHPSDTERLDKVTLVPSGDMALDHGSAQSDPSARITKPKKQQSQAALLPS